MTLEAQEGMGGADSLSDTAIKEMLTIAQERVEQATKRLDEEIKIATFIVAVARSRDVLA